MELLIDEEIRDFNPALKDEEREGLEKLLLAEGCREALVVADKTPGIKDNTILDGHHRYQICNRHDIEFKTAKRSFPSRNEALLWVRDNQLSRRNLTDFHRAELVLKGEAILQRMAKERQGTRTDLLPKSAKSSPIDTRKELAKAAGVSGDSIHKVKKVLASGNRPVIDKARAGEVSINGAYKQVKKEALTLQPTPSLEKVQKFYLIEDWKKLPARDRAELLAMRDSKARLNEQKNTSIEWAKWSLNIITGCRSNCPYCYARDIANDLYPHKFEPAISPERLGAPYNTPVPATAKENIGYKNIFTGSMADMWGKWVPDEWIEAVLRVVKECPQWNFLFLTKFPIRMSQFEYPDNAWLGTTVDVQARVANAERAFSKVKAKVKWLSCEPLLGPLQFSSLGMFQWVVIGGASKSTQTPEYYPPRKWIMDLEEQADKAGCMVYEKTNLWFRRQEYPEGKKVEYGIVPPELQYLPVKNQGE
ncbi:MAG: DUF5131 family protein [Deltaproteobacteria bacterium]|nr:DUF5131 family protein [Deltaproteobacteria bacterium]